MGLHLLASIAAADGAPEEPYELRGPFQLAARRSAGAGASVAGASGAAAGPSTTRRSDLERRRALRLAECARTIASLPAVLLDRVLSVSDDPYVQGEVGRTSLQAGVCRRAAAAQTSAPSCRCGLQFGVNATVNAYKQAMKRGDLTRRILLEEGLMDPFCAKCMKVWQGSVAVPLPELAGASAQREGAFTLTHYEVAHALTHLPISRWVAPG